MEEFGRNSLSHIVPETANFFHIFEKNPSKFVIFPAHKKLLLMAKEQSLKLPPLLTLVSKHRKM